jgi:Tudor domain
VYDRCSSSVDVLFIDFGESETDVAFSRVRKLPYELRNAPVLGMQVTVIGNL